MNKLKEFLNKLKNPNRAVYPLTFILSVIFIALAISLVVLYPNGIINYVVYVFSAVGLAYSIYLIVLIVPKIKGAIISAFNKRKFTRELYKNFGFRKLVFAIVSFILNVLYALTHAVFGILSKSIWLGALATYYIAISAIRGGAIVASSKTRGKTDMNSKLKQIKSYRNCGIYTVLLNFALLGALVQMVIANQGFLYAGYLIYVMAAFTFYKVIFSVKDLIKLRHADDYSIRAINKIGVVSALVSLFALQTAMFAAFGQGINTRLPNAITGGIVSMLIIGIGVLMIIESVKIKRRLLKE
ncbi:MAG: hypothetical protein IJV95_03565 [Clostridia bacterium]|nr:hypothetical protein [Clostridia bacterium]